MRRILFWLAAEPQTLPSISSTCISYAQESIDAAAANPYPSARMTLVAFAQKKVALATRHTRHVRSLPLELEAEDTDVVVNAVRDGIN